MNFTFSKFVGWYLSEGSLYASTKKEYDNTTRGISNKITISQDLINEDYRDEIESALNSLIYEGLKCKVYKYDKGFSFNSDLYAEIIETHLGIKFNKYISKELINSLNLKVVLDAMYKGDGTKSQRQYNISQKNESLFNTYIELLLRCGHMFTYRIDSGCYRIVDNTNDITLKKDNTTVIKYTGKVYSLTVKDNHTVYAGLNGRMGWIGQSIYGLLGLKSSVYGDMCSAMMVTAMCRWTTGKVIRRYKDILVELDSVTGDTPVYVLNKETNELDIIPIEDLHGSGKRSKYDGTYKVLTRHGWKEILYTKKHTVKKNIHRIKISDGYTDVTCDHSLFSIDKKEIKPLDIKKHKTRIETTSIPNKIKDLNYGDSIKDIDFCWLIGFFIAEGSAYEGTKKTGEKKRQISFNGNDKNVMEKVKLLANKHLGWLALDLRDQKKPHKFKLHNTLRSSAVYKVQGGYNKLIVDWFKTFCYTKNRKDKKVPTFILNGSKEMKESFLNGLMCGDGYNIISKSNRTIESLDSKFKSLAAGVRFLWNELGFETTCNTRKDKLNMTTYRKRVPYKTGKFKDIDRNIVHYNNIISEEDTVYDISTEDGTFVTALGDIVLHNTDGLILDEEVDEDETNKWLDGLVEEHFGIKDNYMQMELDDLGRAYFYAMKNYIVEEHGEYMIHGSSMKASRAARIVDRAIKLGIEHIFNNKPKEEVLHEALDFDNVPLEDFTERVKLSKEPREYDDQLDMRLFLAEQMKIKTGQTATKGTQFSYVVTKDQLPQEEFVPFYRGGKNYTFIKYVEDKSELNFEHYKELVLKALEKFGIQECEQLSLFGDEGIKPKKPLDIVPDDSLE